MCLPPACRPFFNGIEVNAGQLMRIEFPSLAGKGRMGVGPTFPVPLFQRKKSWKQPVLSYRAPHQNGETGQPRR